MLQPMKQIERMYSVNGVAVTLVRDQHGARWECDQCGRECEHVLQAVAWLTVASWAEDERPRLQ
jgi:hypothetical protein